MAHAGRTVTVVVLILILTGAATPALNDPLPPALSAAGSAAESTSQNEPSWAGFGGVTINEMLADRLELPSPGGVIVTFVHPEGPAAKAGLATKDMILLANGESIPDGEAWSAWLAGQEPGTRIELSVRRENVVLSLEMMLEERPPNVEVEPLRS
jgi:S1-C subfamily serine protease